MLKQTKKSIPDAGAEMATLNLQTDKAGIILSASSGLCLFTGILQNDLLGNSFKTIIGNSDKEKLQAILDGPVHPGALVPLTIKGKEGSYIVDFTLNYKKKTRETNQVLQWEGVLPAIQHNWFDKFFRFSDDMLCLAARDGYFKKVNGALVDLLGYSEEELCSKPFIEFVHPDDRQRTIDAGFILNKRKNIKEFENRYCCRNGEIKWLSWSATFLEDDGLLLGIGRNVTDKKQAEEELKQKTGELEVMVSSLDDVVFEYDEAFRFKKCWCSDHALLSIMPGGFIGKTPQQVFGGKPRLAAVFTNDLEQCLYKKEIEYREFFVVIDNEIKWYQSKVSPLFDDGGKPKGFAQRITDISEKKKVELAIEEKNTALKNAHQELKEVIERYKVFVQQSSEIIWRCELQKPLNVNDAEDVQLEQLFNGYLAECNDQMALFYGYKDTSQIIGQKVACFFDPHEPVTNAIVREFIQQGYKLYRRLSMHLDHEGNKRYFLNNLVGVVENGYLLRVWTTQNEITQQRMAEKANRYQARILENVFDAVISTGPDFAIRSWNHAAEKLYGLMTADVMGHTIHEFLQLNYHNTTRDNVLEQLYENGAWTGEASFIRPADGKKVIFWSSISLLKNKNGDIVDIIAINKDVTEWHMAQQTIRESEERFRLAEDKIRFQVQVMQDVSDGIISTDLDATVISFNKAAENIYGITGDAIIGKPLHDFINLSYVSCTWEDALKELHEKGSWEGQAWYNRHDGRRIYLHCSLSFVKNERGTRVGFAGIYRDITEARQSQEALRINEERYRSVVHAMGEGIIMYDKSGDVVAYNRSAEAILGMSTEMMTSKSAFLHNNFCLYEDGTPFPAEQHPSFITLKTGKSLQNVVMGLQRMDGTLVWISINTEPIYYTQQRVHPDAVVASFVDITQKKAAEIELQRSQQQLREYSERITNILASITDGFIAVDKNLHIFLWNHAVEDITGLKAKNVVGLGIDRIFPKFAGTTEYKQYTEAISKGISVNFEHFIPAFDRWLETSVYPFAQGAFIYFRDITDRKKQEQLLELEKEVLKINAQPAASLKTTVTYFLEGLEKAFPDMLCSVVTLDDSKNTIHHLAAPGLPVEYTNSIDGIKIGPAAGSCGTAVFRKERVITTDIDTDPLWNDFRHLAQKARLRSCWSFPILTAANEVLATVAVYHRYPKTPAEKELNMFERIGNLLRVIIENKISEAKIRLSNERYLLVTKATNDAIWDWDVNTSTLYWGEGIYTLFGYKPGYVDSLDFWEVCIHPDDKDRVINGMNQFINDNTSQVWEDEYRFKKASGEYALVYDRGFLIFDHLGKTTRMVGSMQDITDKREMEKKLLKQELDKQKLIAQAVVNAQEKERAEIGKELHDNVNQILSTAKLYLELAQTDEDWLDLINRSTNNISDAINEIRSISRTLVPPSVGDLGLVDSIQDLVENIKATKKLHVEFYYSEPIDSLLDEKQKLMLFRIIQEQVNNVLKHASARNLVIELIADSEGHSVDLTISDDGKGFELEKIRSKKGVGLSNIASRAQLFNGSVNIVTAAGEGCKLKINVPISNI